MQWSQLNAARKIGTFVIPNETRILLGRSAVGEEMTKTTKATKATVVRKSRGMMPTRGKKSRARVVEGPPSSEFAVRELDPHLTCGPDTSVQLLYRIDERVNGAVRLHLVFFDRHGWYCEHGRDCPAVAHVKKTR
jgi:hypothetical protein